MPQRFSAQQFGTQIVEVHAAVRRVEPASNSMASSPFAPVMWTAWD